MSVVEVVHSRPEPVSTSARKACVIAVAQVQLYANTGKTQPGPLQLKVVGALVERTAADASHWLSFRPYELSPWHAVSACTKNTDLTWSSMRTSACVFSL